MNQLIMDPDAEAVNDLKAALKRLRTNGWQRGKFLDLTSGKCCAVGAFGYPFPTDSPGVPYLAYAVRTRPGGRRYPAHMSDLAVIIRFNDATRRTAAEIESAFVDAIRYAEGRRPHA